MQLRAEYDRDCFYEGICATIQTENEFIALHEFLLNQKAAFNVAAAKESVFYFISRQKIEEIVSKYPDFN